jgi:hypothetical protein
MHLKPLQGSNIGLICKKELRLHSLEEESFGGCVLFCQNPYGKTYGANSILVKTSATGKCLRTRELHAIWDGMGCLTDAARKQYPPILSLGSFNLKISASMAENTFLSNCCKSFIQVLVLKPI